MTMTEQALMLARVTNAPLMVTADYLDSVLGLLAAREGAEIRWSEPPEEVTDGARYRAMADKDRRVIHDGIALIGVDGSLAHKSGRMTGMSSTMRSYTAIRRDLDAALGDERVNGIVFDIDSPGGEVSGNFALAEYIASVRGQKPMLALADEYATSAAYNIAAAADRVVAPSGSLVGSVGVILAHIGEGRALTNGGIDVTLIRAGAHKAEANSVEPLSDEVRSRLQTSVNRTYGRFVGLVSRNRGMEAEAVRQTEARVFDAEEALELGLIDSVESVDDALGSFAERARERSANRTSSPVMLAATPAPTTHEEKQMDPKTGADAGTDTKAAENVDNTAAIEEAKAEARAEEQARVGAIYALASANLSDAHRAMAGEYVVMGLSAERCDELLQKMPAPAAAPAPAKADADDTNALDSMMSGAGADADAVEANLSGDAGEDSDSSGAMAAAREYRRDTQAHVRYASLEESRA